MLRIFGWVGGVAAALGAMVALASVALMVGKYGETSACAAATEAIRQETPAILTELASRDAGLARLDHATRPLQRLRRAVDDAASEAAAERAALKLADRSAAACAGLILYREVDADGFRRHAADRILSMQEERRATRG